MMVLIVIRLDCFKTCQGRGTWENRAAVHETRACQADLHLQHDNEFMRERERERESHTILCNVTILCGRLLVIQNLIATCVI